MPDLKAINEALNTHCRPQTYPLAIRMCQSATELPERVRLPKRDLGLRIPVCQAFSMARRYGWTMAVGPEDQACPFGGVTLGFFKYKPGLIDGTLQEQAGMGPKDRWAKSTPLMSRLEYGKYSHLLAAPLHTATFEPHLILIYGMPGQIGRLIQGTLYDRGGVLTAASSGGAACSRLVSHTILSDECQYVVGAGGDRVFALTQDHEMPFTIPMSKVELTIKGLDAGARTGVQRYPLPVYLQFEPRLPPSYQKLRDLLEKPD